MNYTSIKNFGPNAVSEVNNPLTYCLTTDLDSAFMHGGQANVLRRDSRPCQLFLSEYCAQGWDNFCERASQNQNISFPNGMTTQCGACPPPGTTQGDMLIRNTAERKYLVQMINGQQVFEPFDPVVASSPMISSWRPVGCQVGGCGAGQLTMAPIYAVNPNTIDDDVVMDKILARPHIAKDILVNIYNTMKRLNTLQNLKGTKLGNFYGIN